MISDATAVPVLFTWPSRGKLLAYGMITKARAIRATRWKDF